MSAHSHPFTRHAAVAALLCVSAIILLRTSTSKTHKHSTQRTLQEYSAAIPAASGCIVIIHMSDGSYISGIPMQPSTQILHSIEQLRLFNPDIPVHLVITHRLNMTAAEHKRLDATKTVVVPASTLNVTKEHKQWRKQSTMAKRRTRSYFWRYTTERFFLLADVAAQYGLHDIIHIEYDNLIYIGLDSIMPVLQRHYKIGAVFDKPTRAIAGFMYLKDAKSARHLAKFIYSQSNTTMHDMRMIGAYKQQYPDRMPHLPIFDPGVYPGKVDRVFAAHLKDFGCVFDGAAYGQFIGGIDPRNEKGDTRGFVNKESVVKTDKMKIIWQKNAEGLWVPYADGRQIANLHIHSKNLDKWRSERPVAAML